MLLLLNQWLDSINFSVVFLDYTLVRALISLVCALLGSIVLLPILIKILRAKHIGQSVRNDGPQSHLIKAGTPTMGGGVILAVVIAATLLCADLDNLYIWIVLFVSLSFGLIGLIDDSLKFFYSNSKGLPSRYKYLLLSAAAVVALVLLYHFNPTPLDTAITIPFMPNLSVPLGAFFMFFAYLVIIGSSNAVNLTDGLDGLAILCVLVVATVLGVMAYFVGSSSLSFYLSVPYIQGSSELLIICSAIVGSGLGFLWFNSYPAIIFMGDVGSLFLGGVLGTVAVLIKQEILFFIMSGIFVAETISVILQVGSFKLRRKRIFKMAPLHHHFELKGWSESQVVMRFFIVTLLLGLVAISSFISL